MQGEAMEESELLPPLKPRDRSRALMDRVCHEEGKGPFPATGADSKAQSPAAPTTRDAEDLMLRCLDFTVDPTSLSDGSVEDATLA